MPRAKHPSRATVAQPRASRALQRQRLIDACISALHVHGPSHTTVEKVVAIARMSPGIVRFYFDSKAAMLVASLEFLSAEFEERLLIPVAQMQTRPVGALERLVDLYLGVELASARKVSVWYSFWGEASSRQEYFDICGKRDEKFEVLVRELIGQLIDATGSRHLDPDAIALGLIGVLEMLWQGFAFQTESTIDRAVARRRAMSYLRSVFPTAFRVLASATELPVGAYSSPIWFEAEMRGLLRDAWQFVGRACDLPGPGDAIAIETAADSVLLVRTGGELVALRNICPQRPHALVATGPCGSLNRIACPVHGLVFDLEGRPAADAGGESLTRLDLFVAQGLVFVRPLDAPPGEPPPALTVDRDAIERTAALAPLDVDVAADWKVLVEQWLEVSADASQAPRFVAPNQLIVAGPSRLDIYQVIPRAPGQSRLRHYGYPINGVTAASIPSDVLNQPLAESIQRGLQSPSYVAGTGPAPSAALVEFRRTVARQLPAQSRTLGELP